MRFHVEFYAQPFAAIVSALLLAALLWLDATSAFADGNRAAHASNSARQPAPATSLDAQRPPAAVRRYFFRPSLPQVTTQRPRLWLNQSDEIATLNAIHTALSSVGDGDAYVWQRGNGLLGGLIRPTTSFKSGVGNICRHIVIRLNSRNYSREVEGIACRDKSGIWLLAG